MAMQKYRLKDIQGAQIRNIQESNSSNYYKYYLNKCHLKKGTFFVYYVFGVLFENLKSVFRGRHRKSEFFPISFIKRKWGTVENRLFFGRPRRSKK